MKKRKITITIILLTINILGYCQVDTYDLSKFKLPTLLSQRLNLGFELDNSNTFLKYSNTNLADEARNNFFGKGVLGGEYQLFYNSDRIQSTSGISSSFNYEKLTKKREVDNIETYNDQLNSIKTYLSIANTTNYYFSGKTFAYISPSISYSLNNDNKTITHENSSGVTVSQSKSRYMNETLNTTTNFGIGYGRIEQVNDAQIALYILKDLKSVGRLLREPTHDEITKLAKHIAINNSKSILDSRQRVIDEVKAIDSLLNEMGLANKADAAYFTTIYDNWLYANNPSRFSGYKISAGPVLGYYTLKYIFQSETNDTEFNENNIGYGINANFNYTKPINHKWQHSYSTGINVVKSDKVYIFVLNPEIMRERVSSTLYGQVELGFYPNTRTFVSFMLSTWYDIFNEKETYLETDGVDLDFYSRVYGYYYLSPKLRMNFNLNFTVYNNYYSYTPISQNTYTNTNKQLDFGGSLGINYFIF